MRRLRGEQNSSRGLIFPEAQPSKWDASLIETFKFFLNYGYYKFGLEVVVHLSITFLKLLSTSLGSFMQVSLTIMVLVAWGRMDLLGSLLLVWLIIFCVFSRKVCRLLWPFFLAYVAVMFVLQYAIYVGLPPILCYGKPLREVVVRNYHKIISLQSNSLLQITLGAVG